MGWSALSEILQMIYNWGAGRVTDAPDGCAATQGALNRLEKWAGRNLRKFSKTQTSSSLSRAAAEDGHGKLILQGQWKQDHLLVTAATLRDLWDTGRFFRYTLKPLALQEYNRDGFCTDVDVWLFYNIQQNETMQLYSNWTEHKLLFLGISTIM